MDLLGDIGPKAALFLGECVGLEKNQFRSPRSAAKAPATTICRRKYPRCCRSSCSVQYPTMPRAPGHDHWTGTVYATNRRILEQDDTFHEDLGNL
jgi:hypothetical protein